MSFEQFMDHLRHSNDPQRRYIVNFDRGPLFGHVAPVWTRVWPVLTMDAAVGSGRYWKGPLDDKELAALAQAKIEATESARRTAANAETERKRRESERKALFARRLDEIAVEVDKKCAAIKPLTSRRTDAGFDLVFQGKVLKVVLFDLGDPEVDFWGYAAVQNWRRDFYLIPGGAIHIVQFVPQPITAGPERHPSTGTEFRVWVVDGARLTGTIQTERRQGGLNELLSEAIESLINLA